MDVQAGHIHWSRHKVDDMEVFLCEKIRNIFLILYITRNLNRNKILFLSLFVIFLTPRSGDVLFKILGIIVAFRQRQVYNAIISYCQ